MIYFKQKVEEDPKKKEIDYEEGSDEAMMAMMGLPVGFDTTKGDKVENNDVGTFKSTPIFTYRQYMNRRGLNLSFNYHN